MRKVFANHPCRNPSYIPEYARRPVPAVQPGAGAGAGASAGASASAGADPSALTPARGRRQSIGGTRGSMLDRVFGLGAFDTIV